VDSRYEEHLRVLLQGGQALARVYPRAADRLAARGFDPDVERLLEGLAHITSKIEAKHDHSFPEICQLMLDILFPHFLCPLPALGVAELSGEPCRVPRGTGLEMTPVMETACRFQTAYDVELTGLELEEVSWRERGRQRQLSLRIGVGPEASLGSIDTLRLHLHGEPLLTRSLYHWLLARLDSLELLDSLGRTVALNRSCRLRPLGFSTEEALFPWPFGSFPGFRLIQEYFALPQKLLFVEVPDVGEMLEQLPPAAPGEPERFTLRFNLRVDGSRALVVTRQNIRLHCTPVVNLFAHSADPIQHTHRSPEFLVRPAGPHLHYQVYRLTRVTGWSPTGTTHYPLLSELDMEDAGGSFCQVFRRQVGEDVRTYISVYNGSRLPSRETLLCDLLCSNGKVPMGLRVGDGGQLDGPFQELGCRLITPLTPSASVPMGRSLRWRLVKHLALAQRDLTSLEAMRDAVALYNFPAIVDPQLRRALALLLRGMLRAETQLVHHRHQRIPVLGHSTTLTMDESAFDTEAELFLFGGVLNEYVALQAPINTFSELQIHTTRSQDVYRWPKRLGKQTLAP